MGRRTAVVVAALAAAVAAWWLVRPGPPGTPYLPPPDRTPVAPTPTNDTPWPGVEPKPAVEVPPPAATPSMAPAAAGGVAVKGRVVDDRRFPVGGARVTLVRRAQPPLSAVAGPDGDFRFEGIARTPPAYLPFGLLGRAPDGRTGLQESFVPPRGPPEVDVGVVVVGVALALEVRVLDGGAPVAGARVAAGRDWSWPFETVTGADGLARFDALPRQAVSVFAAADGPARAGRAEVALQSNPPQPVDLVLAPARTVEVTVAEKGTDRPIAGATFRVLLVRRGPGTMTMTDPGPLAPVAPTDADGRTRIEGTCAADSLSLDEATAPGFSPTGFQQRTLIKAGDTQARIELAGLRVLRFPVTAGESPVPPDGAAVVLSEMPGSGAPLPVAAARMDGTDLVTAGASAGYFNAIATAPDGSRAQLWADDKGTPPKEVSFRPARTIEVLAKRADGIPAARTWFSLRNQGNNPVAEPRATGKDGRVVFDGLFGQLVEVCLLDDPAFPWGGRAVGSVDLAKGGGSLEVVVPGKRTFVARVTVDGVPRLAPQMYVSMNQGAVARSRFDEDPAKGEIRFELPVEPDAKSVVLLLSAPPYLPATATIGPVPGTGTIPVEFALKTGGVLLVEVRAPRDSTAYRLGLQRWDDATSSWIAANVPGAMAGPGLAPGPDGIARCEPLLEGRYRVVEITTGISSEPVEVRSGGEPARLVVDVSRQGYAKGWVRIPEGATLADVRVLVRGDGIATPEPARGLDYQAPRPGVDGSFRVRVPGDRPVQVVPWHPVLVPAAEGGIAEVTEPRDDLVLRLVQGALATIRFSPAPEKPPWLASPPRVLLYRGEPEGEPEATLHGVLDGDRLSFGGFPAGSWTVWIDMLTAHAPAVLRDAKLGAGDADLGGATLSEGSRVRVKVLVKEGTSVPRISVYAMREDAPKYGRQTSSNGEETAVLPGLGRGRFRIVATSMMGTAGKQGLNEIHEVDGVHDLELTLDLR
jgi:hypothetical protein